MNSLQYAVNELEGIVDKVLFTQRSLHNFSSFNMRIYETIQNHKLDYYLCSKDKLDEALDLLSEDHSKVFNAYFQIVEDEIVHLDKEKKSIQKKIRRQSENFKDIAMQRDEDIHNEYLKQSERLNDDLKSIQKIVEERIEERDIKQKELQKLHDIMNETKDDTIPLLEKKKDDLEKATNTQTKIVEDLRKEFLSIESCLKEKKENAKNTNGIDALHESEKEKLEAVLRNLDIQETQQQEEISILKQALQTSSEENEIESLIRDCSAMIEDLNLQFKRTADECDEARSQIPVLSSKMASLIRSLASTSAIGTLMSRIFQHLEGLEDDATKKMSIPDAVKLCANHSDTPVAITEMIQMGVLRSENNLIELVQ